MKKRFLACLLAIFICFSWIFASCSKDDDNGDLPQGEYELTALKRIQYLEDGETQPLAIEFTVDGEEADWSFLTYVSNNESVATVDEDGNVTGVSSGIATVTISIGEISENITINVKMRKKTLQLSETKTVLVNGETKQIVATAYNGSTKDTNAEIVWQSENPQVVTVNNGLLTGVSNGETTVKVSYGEVEKTILVSVLTLNGTSVSKEQINTFDEKYINVFSCAYIQDNALILPLVSSAVEVGILGTSLTIDYKATSECYLKVYVDDDKVGNRFYVPATVTRLSVASGLSNGQHKIRIVNTTECTISISSFEADRFWAVPEKSNLSIQFIGDSITCGYGVTGRPGEGRNWGNSDGTLSYAYVAADALDAHYTVIASSGICVTATNPPNFTMNMETLYPNILGACEYVVTPDVIVLNLGTNDGDKDSNFASNYEKFLRMLREKHPNAYIICLYGMMGYRSNVVQGIQSSLSNLSDPKIVYNPFTIEENRQGADGHPDQTSQKAWGEALADYINSLFNN